MSIPLVELQPLLGLAIDDPVIAETLRRLVPGQQDKDVKVYGDEQFHNYNALGMSLCFVPGKDKSRPAALDMIDIFNGEQNKGYSSFPLSLDIGIIDPVKGDAPQRAAPFTLQATSLGRDVVRALGEPKQKGTLDGRSIWLRYPSVCLSPESGTDAKTDLGPVAIMFEFKEARVAKPNDEQRKTGMGGIWDRAAFWPWSSVKIYKPDTPSATDTS